MSRATDGFSATTSVLPTSSPYRGSILGRLGAPEERALPTDRGGLASAATARLPLRGDGPRAPALGRLRPRGRPPLQLRPVAARDRPLPALLRAVHGEVGALLAAALPPPARRRRLRGAPGQGRPGGAHDRPAPRPRGLRGGDVPGGDAAGEGAAQAPAGGRARRSGPDRRRRRLARAPRLPRAAGVGPAERSRRPLELPAPALGRGAARRRARRLGHARGRDLPPRGVRRLPGGARVRATAPRPARPPTRLRRALRLRLREGAGLRGGRLPRRRRAPLPRPGPRRHLRSGRLPARERAGDDPPAPPGGEPARAHRARRGARALRRRARPGPRLHRPPRRPLRPDPRRARGRPEDGRGRARAVRLARARAPSRALRRRGRRPPPLPPDRAARREGPAADARPATAGLGAGGRGRAGTRTRRAREAARRR